VKANDSEETRALREAISAEIKTLTAQWRKPVGSEICQPARERCAKDLEELLGKFA
jgi:hypothetical protein